MSAGPTLWGVSPDAVALNILLTAGVVFIAANRIAAVVVFVPLHLGAQWLCDRRADQPKPEWNQCLD